MPEENNSSSVVYVVKEKKKSKSKRFHKFFWPCILFSVKLIVVVLGFLGYWFGISPSSTKPTVDNHAVTKAHLPPGQLCPEEWLHFNLTDQCYKYFHQKWSFRGAEQFCANKGAHLASIHTKEENDFVREISEIEGVDENRSSIWIGAYSPKKDNVFVWTDNSTWDFTWFHPKEPNLPGLENCLEMYYCSGWMVYCWMNVECDNWFKTGFVFTVQVRSYLMLPEINQRPVVLVVSEKKKKSKAKRFHKFFWPCMLFSLKITLVLLGFLGYWYGFKSGGSTSTTEAPPLEIRALTTHAASTSLPPGQLCPDGWDYFNQTDSCYKYYKQTWSFKGSEQFCVSRGAHMVSIHTKEENDFVCEMSEIVGVDENRLSIWIGGYAPNKDNVFAWLDNSTWDYSWFHPAEPNMPGKENCLEIYACGGDMLYCWNNVECAWHKTGFVCKKGANRS
ncbi:hypothetical protein QR680_008333 [Steinernema hermaphroditum]|uniref:C-type lectin domain-containing protein n=1 Tax=Steinernema hermaphroditum TaxID=289476 RepID=A0AA39IG80_9BILA|nr:hypothetical protein QR680_008333 [Steinernema hermaphroditum]